MLDLVLAIIIVSIIAFLIVILVKYVLNPLFFPNKLPLFLIDKYLTPDYAIEIYCEKK